MQLCASSHKIKNKDLATWRRVRPINSFLKTNYLPNLFCFGYFFSWKTGCIKSATHFNWISKYIGRLYKYISLYPITGSKLFLGCNLFDWIWWGHLLILMQFKHNKCIYCDIYLLLFLIVYFKFRSVTNIFIWHLLTKSNTDTYTYSILTFSIRLLALS